MRTRLLLCLAIPLAATGVARASAQQPVGGVVTDSATGAAVAGASARLKVAGAVEETNAMGAFSLSSTRATSDTLVIHRIGYVDEVRVVTPMERDTLRVRLRPDPVMLAALEIMGRSTGMRRTADTGRWAEGPGGPRIKGGSVLELLEDRLGYQRVACERVPSRMRPHVYCSMIRGNAEPIRAYVDESLAAGGLDDLAQIPLPAVYSVTISRDRRVVSLVTNAHVEEMAWDYLLQHGGAMP